METCKRGNVCRAGSRQPGLWRCGAAALVRPPHALTSNGTWLLNGSVDTAPLAPVFLSAGLNVISAANGAVSTDYDVRDGGSGMLP